MREIRNLYYEAGSAAHKLETWEEFDERQKLEEERRAERRRRRKLNNDRALRKNKQYTVVLLAGTLVFGVIFCFCIGLQSKITTSMRNISKLENEIQDLKAENAATESRIATSSNLESIKKTAMEKLGMVYAKHGQIVYYTMDDEDYMSQYKDVK